MATGGEPAQPLECGEGREPKRHGRKRKGEEEKRGGSPRSTDAEVSGENKMKGKRQNRVKEKGKRREFDFLWNYTYY